jgi:hypothetical protein
MTDEARAIEPALTAEEWQALPDAAAAVAVMALPSLRRQPERMQIVMALANAALPDGDPRKITRAHVRMLESLRAAINKQRKENFEGVALLDELIASLSALLPPET